VNPGANDTSGFPRLLNSCGQIDKQGRRCRLSM